MSLKDILPAKDIEAGLKSVEKEGSFESKKFFVAVRLHGMPSDYITRVFEMLDRNRNGTITEDEVGEFLQNFSKKARPLNAEEKKKFMKDGDFDGDGKIGIDDFQAMVNN